MFDFRPADQLIPNIASIRDDIAYRTSDSRRHGWRHPNRTPPLYSGISENPNLVRYLCSNNAAVLRFCDPKLHMSCTSVVRRRDKVTTLLCDLIQANG